MSMPKVGVIGTAGRDKSIPMTKDLWNWMIEDLRGFLVMNEPSELVSGGAAWADHLAVYAFLEGWAPRLTLYLPAPMMVSPHHQFIGPRESAASASNYYHERFSNVVGFDSREQIMTACLKEACSGSVEPEARGYGALFTRNKKVAAASEVLFAYTFGQGDVPMDGGTKNTWDQCVGTRIHVTLPKGLT